MHLNHVAVSVKNRKRSLTGAPPTSFIYPGRKLNSVDSSTSKATVDPLIRQQIEWNVKQVSHSWLPLSGFYFILLAMIGLRRSSFYDLGLLPREAATAGSSSNILGLPSEGTTSRSRSGSISSTKSAGSIQMKVRQRAKSLFNIFDKLKKKSPPSPDTISHQSSIAPASTCYQLYEADLGKIQELSITVVRGIGIQFKNDSACCSVTLKLLGTPIPVQKTRYFVGAKNPVWNETFRFHVNPERRPDILFGLMFGREQSEIELLNFETIKQNSKLVLIEFPCVSFTVASRNFNSYYL